MVAINVAVLSLEDALIQAATKRHGLQPPAMVASLISWG
jgi:hypothetical protein